MISFTQEMNRMIETRRLWNKADKTCFRHLQEKLTGNISNQPKRGLRTKLYREINYKKG